MRTPEEAKARRKEEYDLNAAERKRRRHNAIETNSPLEGRTVQMLKGLFRDDVRFRHERFTPFFNVTRNIGKSSSVFVHLAIPEFRQTKCFFVCGTPIPEDLAALKGWKNYRPQSRELLLDLPMPTNDPASGFHLYEVIASHINKIPIPPRRRF